MLTENQGKSISIIMLIKMSVLWQLRLVGDKRCTGILHCLTNLIMPNPNLKSKKIYNVSFSRKMDPKVQKSCFRWFSGAPGPHMGGDRIF